MELIDIDIDTKSTMPKIQIGLGSFNHEIKNAMRIDFKFSLSGDEDGLDICDNDGRTTVLRFEERKGIS